tara:strand:+ start:71 stop:238 length:168 start_codon:yes stop_codon:yes gene_type:complete
MGEWAAIISGKISVLKMIVLGMSATPIQNVSDSSKIIAVFLVPKIIFLYNPEKGF